MGAAEPNTGLPTFEEEFDRKLCEALRDARLKFEAGKISNVTYQHVLEAINTVARGLCDEPLILAIDQERDLAGFDPELEIGVWEKGNTLLVATRERSGDKLRLIKASGDKPLDGTTQYDRADVPHEASMSAWNKLVARLGLQRYTRLI